MVATKTIIFALLGLVGLATASSPTQEPTYEPTYESSLPFPGCVGAPSVISCSRSFGLKETKLIQSFSGGDKLIVNLSCRGDGVAYGCLAIDPFAEGLVGLLISGDSDEPMCYSQYWIGGGAKKYQTSCKGHGFKVTETIRYVEGHSD